MRIKELLLFCTAFFLTQSITAGEWHATSAPVELVRNESANYMNPLWSVDGRYLAFTKANYRGILILDTQTQAVNEINDEIGAGFGMLWSQQKPELLTRVAEYRGYRRYSAVKVFQVEVNTEITIVPYQKSMPDVPRWTETGNVYYADNSGIKLVARSNGVTNLAKAKVPQNLFVVQRRALAVTKTPDASPVNVPDFAQMRVINLSWSPDFTKIVFEVIGGTMYTMDADAKNITNLGIGFRPKWSPDSRAIVFMLSEDDGHRFTKSDLYIINADGTGRSEITSTPDILEMNPSWGYDGGSLVYDVLGEGAIYSIEVQHSAE
ncbi:MAG: PD40 domain-containing protein [Deferribacteres bacterium]|nr:PD40 domain-containing protein [candidate division KSB1 bacterium]MCB9502128.1 PD40 domain-containing protein [Deferribacteres bacterium]